MGVPRGTRGGPPTPSPGDDHRVYAGRVLLDAELPSMDLHFTHRLVLRLRTKRKLPADDLWLVTREGELRQLQMIGELRRGSVPCQVLPARPTKP